MVAQEGTTDYKERKRLLMHSRSLELCQRWEWGHSTWVVAAHLNKEVLCDRAVWSEVRANDDALSAL